MALSLAEALDNLQAVIEVDSMDHLELVGGRLILHTKEDPFVGPGLSIETLEAINQTFSVIYEHVQKYYEQGKGDARKVRHLSMIMTLVGEVTHKLESLDKLFVRQVIQAPDYQLLQDFYRSRVITDYSQHLQRYELVAPSIQKGVSSFLNEMITVAQDDHYELFFLLNELGYPFYDEGLIKELRHAAHQIWKRDQLYMRDPILLMKLWEEQHWQQCASMFIQENQGWIQRCYAQAVKHPSHLAKLYKMMVCALYLSAKKSHVLQCINAKSSGAYFRDFLVFLRDIIHQDDFKRELEDPFFVELRLGIRHSIYWLYTFGANVQPVIESMGWDTATGSSYDVLDRGYHQLISQLDLHPSGPLVKAIDAIYEHCFQEGFDPWLQGNMLYPLYQIPALETTCLYIPSPTHQYTLDEAHINEEFVLFIEELNQRKEGMLIIHIQHQNQWEDRTRCEILKKYAIRGDQPFIHTAILPPLDALFPRELRWEAWMEQHLLTDAFYDAQWKGEKEAYQKTASLIKQMKVETEEGKMILCYAIYLCALVEAIHPKYLSFSSKDALDHSVFFIASLWMFQKQVECSWLQWLAFGPILLQRERAPREPLFQYVLMLARLLTPERKKKMLAAFPWLHHPFVHR